MQPKLFKTSIAEYVPAEWTGKNESGVHPIGDRVLIKPDKAADIVRGILMPDDITARHSLAAEGGVVVQLGDGAFMWNHDRQTPFHGRKPQPGERVVIEKYAGQLTKGDDGEMYRLMESASIGALITAEKKTKLVAVKKETK